MKPFDDALPTEYEEKMQRLITLLRQAYSQEQINAESEQQEAIMRVEERLAKMEEDEALPTFGRLGQIIDLPLPQHRSRLARRRRVARVINALAAALVVGMLLGGAILLFTHPRTGTVSKSGLSEPTNMPGSMVKWAGLEMSMHITPGPYFLGELLAVDFSLTNRTHQTLALDGLTTIPENLNPKICFGYAFSTEQTGGESPHFTFFTTPILISASCPLATVTEPYVLEPVAPGKTVTSHLYEPLTSSGDVTLIGKVLFSIPETGPHGVTDWQPGSWLLAGHIPTIRIYVSPQAPANRILTLHQEGSEILIDAPAGVQLVDQTYLECRDVSDHIDVAGDNHIHGKPSDYWHPLLTKTLLKPACSILGPMFAPGTVVQWKYAIGAAGYAIVQGQSTG